MKNLKLILLTVMTILGAQAAFSQAHPPFEHAGRKGPGIETLKKELNLSSEQEEQIRRIFEKYDQQREALRDEHESGRFEMHEKMGELMEAQKAEIDQILTDEQKTILDTKMKEKHQRFSRERRQDSSFRRAEHDEMEKYREANIQPVLVKQRAKLEERISQEDKAVLNEIRPVFKAMEDERERRFMQEDQREQMPTKAEREQFRQSMKEAHEKIRPQQEKLGELVKKYEKDIDELFAEIKGEHEKWQEDTRKIHEKYTGQRPGGQEGAEPEDGPPHMRPHRRDGGMHHPEKDRMMKKGHFLLLDPAAETASATSPDLILQMTVTPNPAVSQATLEYELKADAPVRIEWRNEQGLVLKTLFDRQVTAGTQTLQIDLADQKSGVYYLSVATGKNSQSKKIIVAR